MSRFWPKAVARAVTVTALFSYILSVPQESLAQQRPSFAVASVRLRQNAPGPQTTDMKTEPDGIRYLNASLKSCIVGAYGLKDYQLDGLDGRPLDRYDIVAKAERRVTRGELMQMLQVLLEERFDLKYHMTTRTGPAYRVSASSGGTKLAEAVDGEPGSEMSPGRLVATRMSPQRLGNLLAGFANRPVVVDSEGIPSAFNLTLTWTPADTQADATDAVFDALRREYGLRIAKTTISIETMVVDRIKFTPKEN